jgi:hypothetical protein
MMEKYIPFHWYKWCVQGTNDGEIQVNQSKGTMYKWCVQGTNDGEIQVNQSKGTMYGRKTCYD